jgi:ABC-type multidrug transport system ATPase subunit
MSLHLHSVTRRYGSQLALDGVELELRPGECLGFIGHNGAGKTTAMRIALGLVAPHSGRATVDGYDVRRSPRTAHARMGALIERPAFFDSLDGARNLRRLARAQGIPGREIRAEVDRVLELVGLSSARGKAVGNYSQGMRQRLGIAQALLGSPRYLLLDEPANGLDPEGMAEMRALVRRLAHEEGHGVILSSHLLGEVAEVCDRIAVLKQGRLLLEGPSEEILARGTGRYRLRSPDLAAAQAQLGPNGLGLELTLEHNGEELSIDPAGTAPEAITRCLVEAAVPVSSFAAERASLEAIYLELERGDARPTPRPADPKPERAEIKTPGFGVLRAARWELTRLFGGFAGWTVIAAPAILSAVLIARRASREAARAAELAAEGAFHERATAFGAVAQGLAPTLPLLALLLALLASQSIAGEIGRGTMRNLVLRPFRRWEIVTGKAFALFGVALAAYALLAATTLGAAAWFFDFVGLAEVLPNGELFDTVAAEDLHPELKTVLQQSAWPMVGYAGLGFACGALVRQGTTALALALGAWFGEALLRGGLDARSRALEGGESALALVDERYMLSSYLPSYFGDANSPLRRYEDIADGVNDAVEVFTDTLMTVPFAWAFGGLAIALALFSRRSIS